MAARVAAPPQLAQSYVNTDPGVYEPECDWGGPAEPTGYPDTEQFLNGYAGGSGGETEADPGPPAPPLTGLDTQQCLPLAGDYQGLGGPTSVPLYTPAAFETPARPVEKTILDEIFLEPTDKQLDAYYRVILRGKVAQNKNRLKWAIFVHFLLLFLMMLKLTPEVLDRLDVFVLEVEELFVPAPLVWEWLWLLSLPVTIFGLNTCKHHSLKSCKQFLSGTLICSILPVIIGMVCHGQDCYEFLTEGLTDNVTVWQGLPYSMLWYGFFFVSLQVHCFQVYFANCLMLAWLPPIQKKTE